MLIHSVKFNFPLSFSESSSIFLNHVCHIVDLLVVTMLLFCCCSARSRVGVVTRRGRSRVWTRWVKWYRMWSAETTSPSLTGSVGREGVPAGSPRPGARYCTRTYTHAHAHTLNTHIQALQRWRLLPLFREKVSVTFISRILQLCWWYLVTAKLKASCPLFYLVTTSSIFTSTSTIICWLIGLVGIVMYEDIFSNYFVNSCYRYLLLLWTVHT